MSIECNKGKMQIVCDDCGEGFRAANGRPGLYEQDEFDVMIEDAKDNGWLLSRESKEWAHTCPDCLR